MAIKSILPIAGFLLFMIPRQDTLAFQPSIGFQRQPRMCPLFLATTPDLNSKDPFAVLGLDPNDKDSLDKKVIKRAYKRLALKYHPDVATNKDSTDEERRIASDQFATINAAYETLIGKREGNFASSQSTSTGSSGGGWTPPHRRQSSYSSSSSSSSQGGVDWEDFMPKYDDSKYDAGGDSFGAIFADLLGEVVGSAAGYGGSGGGVFNDFVDFLERNVDGYGGSFSSSRGGNDDADLNYLLRTGTVDEVGEELDDTELVVQQLTTKQRDIEAEILSIKADLAASTRFSAKIALEEREAECKARKGVVDNYLKKGRKRLLALQTRYKELIVGGANDGKAGGRSAGRSYSSSSQSNSYNTGAADTSSRRRSSSSTNPEDAWKTEGFGSNGRSRGSGRRRSSRSSQRQSTSSTSYASSSSSSNQDNYSSSTGRSAERSASSSSYSSRPSTSETRPQPSSSPASKTDYNVPPHRRTGFYREQEDKQRLRDLKVDDEFEKLKKELGL